jgi:uncharacterized protein (TIGR02757 family)
MILATRQNRMIKPGQSDLKGILQRLYAKYNRRELVKPDPLQFVYRYSKPADMEIAGFLSASLAYGRVQQIENDLNDLFGRMGNSPFDFVQTFNGRKRQVLKGFKHRFTTGDDIGDLLGLLRNVLARFGGLEGYFLRGYDSNDENIVPALSKFCDSLLDMAGRVSKGLAFLLPRPAAGSACKRLNLFLRWMVRKDDVDAGLWQSIDKSKLVVPVDVHIGRLCRILGFHNHKVISLKTAIEITRGFAEIEPSDPVKYDFALSRIGIVEDCNGKYRAECEECELFGYCLRRKGWRR